jgi:anti-sigma regulatory factor (Ser/Thr protein kinase)
VHQVVAADGLRHVVLFYRGIPEYRAAVRRLVSGGLSRSEPVLFAAPRAGSILPPWPAASAGRLTVTDVTELGRNPARIIAALRAFCDRQRGGPVRIVSESIWPGRTPAEVSEATRHEMLVGEALAGVTGTLVCPYSAALPMPALADAACTHPWQLGPDAQVPSPAYREPGAHQQARQPPLPRPPASAEAFEFRSDLRSVRAAAMAVGQRAGLTAARATDLVLAVSELAANTLRHTAAVGVLRAWQTADEVICQVADTGFIADPLAGLRRPQPDQPGGQGLWLVNQVCDLVQIRTGSDGTVIRLHMRLPHTARRAAG